MALVGLGRRAPLASWVKAMRRPETRGGPGGGVTSLFQSQTSYPAKACNVIIQNTLRGLSLDVLVGEPNGEKDEPDHGGDHQ